jgi:hypothetical protein
VTTLRNPLRNVAMGLGLSLATACSGVPTRTFQIDAIDVEDQPVPCLVVVDGDWTAAIEKKQLVNIGSAESLPLKIEFHRPEVNIMVAPVPIDPNTGEYVRLPKSREESRAMTDFLSGDRDVKLIDQQRTLFILRRK